MMTGFIITGFWFIFLGYWAISSRNVKRDIYIRDKYKWVRYIGIIGGILAIALTRSRVLSAPLLPQTVVLRTVAIVLCGAGIGFAIWARVHLGRNWSSAPALKEDHELVTTGPYRFVRHPIYTGLLFAILGSVLISGAVWFIMFFAICAVFVNRVYDEERLMLKTFPQEYPAYMKRTKALIPFLF